MKTVFTQSAKAAGMRATMYAFLAAMFNQRPDRSLTDRLHSFDVTSIKRLTQADDLSMEAVTGFSEIALFIESIDGRSDEEVIERLTIDWTRLFRGVAPAYGPKPPYEAIYLAGDGNESAILQSVMETYIKSGIVPNGKGIDRPDYIGTELDFLALLTEREEEAWRRGDSSSGQNAYLTVQDFLNEHTGRWIGMFCDHAIMVAETGLFRGLLRLTREMTIDMKTKSNVMIRT